MKGNVEKRSDLADLRCCCGSLIARIIKNHVEIKCRRCKRIHHISIESGAPEAPAGRIEKAATVLCEEEKPRPR